METDIATIPQIIHKQREFFATHKTKDLEFRLESLRTLKDAVVRYEGRLFDALREDLGKSPFESYGTEVGLVLEEIGLHIKKLKKWAKPRRVLTDWLNFPAKSRILREPYGVALIVAPWNYPFQLLTYPLVGALSAGNAVALKPAHYSVKTSAVIAEMITECFDPEYVSIFSGGREVNQALFEERFDYLFLTGSPKLGRIAMEKAAAHVTPCTLELGGKSPCIADRDADLEVTARRVVFGKYLNAGQTCIAPDHLYVHADIRAALIDKMKDAIRDFYGAAPEESPDFCRIINDDQFDRLVGLMEDGKIVTGGEVDKGTRYIAPTIIEDVGFDHPIMKEEIFGPLLPVLEFQELGEVIEGINSGEKPLALYYFGKSRERRQRILTQTSAGGGCVNDTVMHLANHRLPFGGVGNSGMGRYHGKYSFDTFTHEKSILSKALWLDIPLRYPPYGDKLSILKKLLH